MQFTSCDGVHRTDLELPDGMCRASELGPGEWCWWTPHSIENRYLIYRPPGCTREWAAPVTTDRERADKRGGDGTYWWWDGSIEHPTLKPSLGVPWPPPYEWHGWLLAGRFEAAE